ncbi:histone-like nucleoid-structuring protein Lsr2 [Brachybacterium huguangmaarense]
MARKTFVELVDDIDGGKADETVSFSLDGVGYEIDLTAENAQRLRDEVGEWAGKARRVSGRRTARTSAPSSASSEETARIREWARENGHQVSDRGRISQAVRDAYNAAH